MPPNRKAKLADALPVGEDFSGFVKSSPYAPLTEREVDIAQEQDSTRLHDHSKKVLQCIMEEERLRQLFSVEHITNNLLVEALKRKKGQVLANDINRLDSMDYRTMSIASMPKERALHSKRVDRMDKNLTPGVRTSSSSPLTNSEESRCSMRSSRTAKELIIKEILEAERIRQLLAVDHIIENTLIQTKMHMSNTVLNAENDSYWTF